LLLSWAYPQLLIINGLTKIERAEVDGNYPLLN
ncbi:unnamed protein product, partial [Rotaria magnacalcarata]